MKLSDSDVDLQCDPDLRGEKDSWDDLESFNFRCSWLRVNFLLDLLDFRVERMQ